jgi:hypothetical protein
MLRHQRNDLITPAKEERSAEDNERVGMLLTQSCGGYVEVALAAGM